MTGMVKTTEEIENTRISPNLDCPTTRFVILKRNHRGKIIFTPSCFRDESTLLQENETTEEAFNRLLPSNGTCSVYHAKLQKVLEAQSHIKNINDVRQAEGEEEKINKEEDKPQLIGEAETAMEDTNAKCIK